MNRKKDISDEQLAALIEGHLTMDEVMDACARLDVDTLEAMSVVSSALQADKNHPAVHHPAAHLPHTQPQFACKCMMAEPLFDCCCEPSAENEDGEQEDDDL